jgi:hypothetical protein
MREEGLGISNANLDKIPIGLDHNVKEDSDGDGLSDAFEDAVGTDPNKADTDDDGYNDYTELKNDYNPKGKNRLGLDKSYAQGQKGRIFLAVERNGEAWYVYPGDSKRYFLGRPDDAFQLMRRKGLGISNKSLNQIKIKAQNQNGPNKNVNEIISYKNHDFGFELFFPKTWEGYLVETKSSVFEKYENSYNTKEISFKLNALDDCNDEYCKIFTITVFDKSDFEQLLKDNKEYIEANGSNVFTDIGKSIGSNNHYTFVIPTNIFGQAYPGPNIYRHQQEAVVFLKNFKTFDVKEDLIKNHDVNKENKNDDFTDIILNCEEGENFSYENTTVAPSNLIYRGSNTVSIVNRKDNDSCVLKIETTASFKSVDSYSDEDLANYLKANDMLSDDELNFAQNANLSDLENDERFNFLFAEDEGSSLIDVDSSDYNPDQSFMDWFREFLAEVIESISTIRDGYYQKENGQENFVNICTGEPQHLLNYLSDSINGNTNASCSAGTHITTCTYNDNVTCTQTTQVVEK